MAEAAQGTAKKRNVPKGRHLSQIKRQRQDVKRAVRNLAVSSFIKTSVKKVRQAIQKKDKKAALEQLRNVTSVLYKAASRGVIHSRNASRRVARLSQTIASL
ncbi:MAG: 30S ribosomal protein S20 [Deltaproteobacteria bacterium]|nr:30S ribosomal protein S20 [Deltaproteobacteria bacterium]